MNELNTLPSRSVLADRIQQTKEEIEKLMVERKEANYQWANPLNRKSMDGDYWRDKRDRIDIEIQEKKLELKHYQTAQDIFIKMLDEKINLNKKELDCLSKYEGEAKSYYRDLIAELELIKSQLLGGSS